MASLDDGVRNLERFIGFLAAASGELGRIAKDLAATERDLAALEDEAAEHGGGLNGRLEDFQSELESHQDSVRDALQELGDAGDGAQDTADEARERLEQAGEEADERIHDAADDVDEAHARLVEQGFVASGRTVDELEGDLETARDEAASVTAELLSSVEGFRADAEAAWDAADGAVETAAAGAGALEGTLLAVAADGVQAMDAEGDELEATCSSLENELAAIYEGLAQSADAEQQRLSDAIESAATEATAFVEASRQERVGQPAQVLEDDALAPLGVELAQLAATLAGAAPLAEALPLLTGDLIKCQGIVGTIDELLQAMAG